MDQPTFHSIDNYLSGTANPEEKAMVEAWYQSCVANPTLTEGLTKKALEAIAAKMWEVISNATADDQKTDVASVEANVSL